jgi:hypothetical protein
MDAIARPLAGYTHRSKSRKRQSEVVRDTAMAPENGTLDRTLDKRLQDHRIIDYLVSFGPRRGKAMCRDLSPSQQALVWSGPSTIRCNWVDYLTLARWAFIAWLRNFRAVHNRHLMEEASWDGSWAAARVLFPSECQKEPLTYLTGLTLRIECLTRPDARRLGQSRGSISGG